MARKGFGHGLSAILTGPDAAVVRSDDRVESLDVAAVSYAPDQPRTHIDTEALASLARSIGKQGVIQPIVVRPNKTGGYWLVAGERRLRATREAGIARIPAIVREIGDRESLVIALVENLQREDLNAIDEARSIARLIQHFGLTHQGAADALGRSRSSVSNSLRLLELDSEVQELVVDGRLDMGQARALLTLEREEQRRYAHQILDGALTAREAEQLVRRARQPPRTRSSRPTSIDPRVPERWRDRVAIVRTRKGANIRLTALGDEELEAFLDWLRERVARRGSCDSVP